ncbi:PrgI family protein [Candidatus Saccharibacteria bacterium]|nr:PrgI family protein [Candidatus Saccharibacteria bacterium]
MAQYKVPQDVEADDKLIGPFSFRQFIYLLVVVALVALAWALAQIFPLLAIFPVIPALFFLVLALPLRKDQPMETYIAALIRFYTTPNKRFWNPGQRESTITITAPKIVEKPLTRDITEEEAGRRLSFLANVVDSEGLSIKGDLPSTTPSDSPVRGEILAEANNATDIYETYESSQVGQNLSSDSNRRHEEIVQEMRAAIKANNPTIEDITSNFSGVWNLSGTRPLNRPTPSPSPDSSKSPQPPSSSTNPATLAAPSVPLAPPPVNPNLIKLAGSDDLSVASLAKQANRESSRAANNNEVYISLH